mmetsp:Transcript_123742/g.344418  ORF Transcript_123742/g.344418 Transcript_123742/m.344418 type:complete len:201 (+) Transcript_123742:1-603(+)
MEVRGALHMTSLGLSFQLAAMCSEAVQLVLSQRLLQNKKLTVLEGLYNLSFPGFVFLCILGSILEWGMIATERHYMIVRHHPTPLLCTACLGVAVNFLTLWVVQSTSAVFAKILSIVRNIGVIVVGMIFYGEVHSWYSLSGYGVSLVGFIGYTVFEANKQLASRFDDWCDALRSCRNSSTGAERVPVQEDEQLDAAAPSA